MKRNTKGHFVFVKNILTLFELAKAFLKNVPKGCLHVDNLSFGELLEETTT